MFYEISVVNINIKTVNINVIYICMYATYLMIMPAHHDIFVRVYCIVHIYIVRDVRSNKNSEISFAPWK